jgi:hypothetical protein
MNRIRPLANVITALLIAAMLTTTTGCIADHDTATGVLWERKWYHPAPKANLQLAQTPAHEDVLVQYDEWYEDSRHPRRRAYWLLATKDKIQGGQPEFVDPASYPGLAPVPMVDASATNRPAAGYYAVVTAPAAFELWRDGASLGSFELPDYYAVPKATGWRIAATPFAVLADGTVIVVVVAVVGGLILGYLWLRCGHPGVD